MDTVNQGDDVVSALERLEAMTAELDGLRRELAHRDRLATIGTLSAGVAHELNNVLTPALGYARLVSAETTDIDQLRKAFSRTAAGVESACRLLDSILGYANPDEGAVGADVAEVLEAALACLGGKEKRGVEIECAVPAGTDVAIAPIALEQVLLNLLLNARRALADRGGTIRVSAARHGAETVIMVADDGPGIPEDMREAIFEPFVSHAGREAAIADGAAPSSGAGGSGLGLSMCRRAIAAASGRICVHPTEGGGATFEITLPALSASARPSAA
jgi:signal transduction histidine kinase